MFQLDLIEIILLSILVGLELTLMGIFLYAHLSEKNIDPKTVQTAKKKIFATESLDPHLSILESHKIMTNALKKSFKNKKLTSAKMLNKVSKKFKDEKTFWHYHRMRNKIAHEDDFEVSKDDAQKARKIFAEALIACK